MTDPTAIDADATDPWVFGLEPLDQTVEVAPLLRRVAGLIQALEAPSEVVDRLGADLRRAERELAALVSAEIPPRVGPDASADRRPYLDHGRDVGSYNPCFPVYELTVDGEQAWGTVTFPIVFEGPPGIVHGGVQATFFDSVIQHHHCEVGTAGRTTALELRYRRPVPLGVSLTFTIEREPGEDRLRSTARLFHGDELLTTAVMLAVAGNRSALPPVSPRRWP